MGLIPVLKKKRSNGRCPRSSEEIVILMRGDIAQNQSDTEWKQTSGACGECIV